MFFRIVLSLFILITASNIVFPMGKGNKTTLSNIKKVELIDKDYRTIAVLPFENLTGNDHYYYISKTIQKFLSNNLSTMDRIKIGTNDYLIPEKFKTNKQTIFSYETNLYRKAIIMNPDTVYKQYIESHTPDDFQSLAQKIKADYIIFGSYKFNKKLKNNFDVSYNVFNVIRENKVYHNQEILDHNKINSGIKNISTEIIDYFHPQETGLIKIVTDFSNYELFIDRQLIHNKINIYKQPSGEHEIALHPLKHKPIKTNIILKAETTNTLIFYQKHYLIKKALLIINTDPANASIYLNVNHIGNSPLEYTNLQKGDYRLEIKKTNYSTCFQNIELKEGTNQFVFSLKKVRTKEYYEEKHKKNKIILYTTLGTGALFMLNTYFFYAAQDQEKDKRDAVKYNYSLYNYYSLWDKYDNNYTRYYIIYQINAFAGIGSLVTSLVYFFKVLNYDDVNIGLKNNNFNTDFAFNNNKYFLSMKYKF